MNLALPLQHRKRVYADTTRQALQALESEVALATLDAAHVGAVDAEHVREGLLAQAESLAMSPQVVANSPLKIAFHVGIRFQSAT